MSGKSDPRERFSSRVVDYVRYRPGYPRGVIRVLRDVIGLGSQAVVADIGSGTGLSARLFLDNGNAVFGVEPNAEMRRAAEESSGDDTRFVSIDGSAEKTGLADGSVDVVVAAQAFHWFDREAVRLEWARILRDAGWVVLMWNERRTDATPFLRAYEELLLRYSIDYEAVRHENVTRDLIRDFIPRGYALNTVYNEQVFDLDGLEGRLRSSSYVPAPGHPGHEPMLEALRRAFEEHCPDGRAVIEYDTVIHTGRFRDDGA
jgi:SAM-dependent methyltransferase